MDSLVAAYLAKVRLFPNVLHHVKGHELGVAERLVAPPAVDPGLGVRDLDVVVQGLLSGECLGARLTEELVVLGVGVDRVDVLLQPPGKLELTRALSAHERLGVFGVFVTRQYVGAKPFVTV